VDALKAICVKLAISMASDGEGATHLITCTVTGAPDVAAAETLGKSVISSTLTKSAIFGADANWGRVLCAMGYSGVDFNPDKVSVAFQSAAGAIDVCKNGRGLAFARYNNLKAYAAVVADVVVDESAHVRVTRVTLAADVGQIVDRDGVRSQLEGGAIQAVSWTLCEQVTYDADGITSRDWDSYPILRFDEVPDVETILIDRPGHPYLGPAECALSPTGAAIANAIHDAVGLRPTRLPFDADALRAAALR
jgi:CO/xanthine dehydrogenase Mo-binding subunit